MTTNDSSGELANHAGPARLPSLAQLQFLLGKWEAISQPGEAVGDFSFQPHLQAHIILRTNYADYPANAERPAFRHEDLMVVYLDEAQALRAVYFDSEGHVIYYAGQVGSVNEVTFTSIPTSTGPGFRLTYCLTGPGVLAGTFEIASPDQPNIFSPYLAWSARLVK